MGSQLKATFRGGVHPAHGSKAQTQGLATRSFVSDTVRIIMNMNIGAPSQPCVAKGDHVKIGQVIGESGEVVSVEPIPYLSEQPAMCVTIHNDFADEWVELHPLGSVETVDPALIIPAIKNAGICGLGGASFPTHVKLSIKPEQKCDCIIANGAECETHLTCDHRLMLENPVRVVDGLRAAMRAINVKEGIIAIEDNKPDAIEAMRKACQGREGVRVQVLKTKYPQGGEKQLIEAVTGRQVPSGGLPIQAGVIVMNVATCAAVADAVIDGKPLVERIVTVTGAVRQPANLRLRIGTITEDIIGECGGFSGDVGKVIFGGAMTGMCAPNTSIPIAKATGGILVLDKQDAASVEEGPCLRCGKCVEVCPIGLHPLKIKIAADADRIDECKRLHVLDCTLCGSCSFICPAHRWLTASFKVAKQKLAAQAKKGGSEK